MLSSFLIWIWFSWGTSLRTCQKITTAIPRSEICPPFVFFSPGWCGHTPVAWFGQDAPASAAIRSVHPV